MCLRTVLVQVTTVPQSFEFFRGQIGYLKSLGFEVIGVSSPGNLLDDFSRREDVPACAVPMTRAITPFKDIKSLWQLYQLFRRIRPTIVHSHTPKGGLLGALAAWLARVPVRFYSIRGLPMTTAKGLKRELLWFCEKIACLCAHRVLCVSHSLRQVVVSEFICSPRKIGVLRNGSGNGVDALGRFSRDAIGSRTRRLVRKNLNIPADGLVIGFVGRIVRDKGIIELYEAWKILSEEFPGVHILIVGPFEQQDSVPKNVEELFRMDKRVHFAGLVGEMPAMYAAMDIVVLPTYREGFPNVPLEAAAMKLPVVATNVPGSRDSVVGEVTGILIPPRDSKALAQAIIRLLENPNLRRKMGKAGRTRALRDFRPEDIWKALAEEYSKLLAWKSPRNRRVQKTVK